jgi:archaellum biogenesis ATPase FlaH
MKLIIETLTCDISELPLSEIESIGKGPFPIFSLNTIDMPEGRTMQTKLDVVADVFRRSKHGILIVDSLTLTPRPFLHQNLFDQRTVRGRLICGPDGMPVVHS